MSILDWFIFYMVALFPALDPDGQEHDGDEAEAHLELDDLSDSLSWLLQSANGLVSSTSVLLNNPNRN